MNKQKILFLCTGNSCRSQMAEGFTNRLRRDDFEAVSGGVAPKPIDPLTIQAMAEAGVDISGQVAKDVDQFMGQFFDWIVTLCDNARENCPFFPGQAQRVHRGFDDPAYLARQAADGEEALAIYRRVRDEIRTMVLGLPDSLRQEE
jgi:arsenate reductase